jgi:membrane peptidoglycan carboxypeptidase
MGVQTGVRQRASLYRHPRGRMDRRLLVLAAAVAVLAIGGLTIALPLGITLAGQSGKLPSAAAVSDASLPQDTLLYDRTGKVVIGDLHPPGYQRYHVSLQQMGTWLPIATVDVEDSNFWHEGGVDPVGILRAALVDLSQRSTAQGGSTITQQLVKIRVTGAQESLTRKIKEAIIATQVARTYSRSQVLEMYLNTIPYGNGSYGAQAAAQNFFRKDAAQLDLAQAALLAGLPRGPYGYDPFSHWDAAKQRQRQVLDSMVRAHSITAAQADQAYVEDLSPPQHMFQATTTRLAPGFIDWVSQGLAQRFGQDQVLTGGLRVTTTLDLGLQQLAQQAVTQTVQANGWRNLSDGAMVASDPRTGQVLAMVGSAGPNVPGNEYNMAVWPPRSPGSTFKLFTYTAAISSKRYTMVTPIRDAPVTVTTPTEVYTPKNDDGGYHGTCELQQCLGNSLNIPAVQVEMGTGVSTVADMAKTMGAPAYFSPRQGTYTDQVPSSTFQPSLTLGTYPETPLQMATGAGVLAAQGVLHQPTGVLSIHSAAGADLTQAADPGRQVVDPGAAYIMSQMLSDDRNRQMIFGSGSPLVIPGRHVAAKTGTAESFTDGWTVGYTPSLAAAVWMGNADGHPMRSQTDGVTVAAPAWHTFMTAALRVMGKGDEWYNQPGDVHEERVGGSVAWFLDGTSAATPAPPLPDNVKVSQSRDKHNLPDPLQNLCATFAWICQGTPPRGRVPGG